MISLITVKKSQEFFRLISATEASDDLDSIEIEAQRMPVHYRRHGRARNYVLRLHTNRSVMVTIPRNGTKKFAREFVASRKSWLEKQWRLLKTRNVPPQVLLPGMEILLHGQSVVLELNRDQARWELRFGTERTPLANPDGNLRPALEHHLQNLARKCLLPRVQELAAKHGARVRRIVVRNQRSRWGSCSYNGTISLNWRLIQLPAPVRDYIIVHELMHLRELNHSPRFWEEVAKACPDYRSSEEWLKQNSGRVGF
ncbi:MAG TPA: SprT family zinc-dependent metalloprotease [Verrucomicrobiae bacterium]